MNTAQFHPSQLADPSLAQTHYQGREIQMYNSGPQFDGTSSYRSEFPVHPLEPRQPISPGSGQYGGNTARFEGTSSYNKDYPAYAVEARSHHGGPQYVPNNLPFDGTSQYKDAFKAPPYDPNASRHGTIKAYQPTNVPFDGSSSYKQDFPAHQLQPRQHHQGPAYQANPVPFDGASSYKADFHAHAMEKTQSSAPRHAPYNPVPFEGTTSYNANYQPHALEPRPAPHPMQYHTSGAPFEGMSESRDRFQAYPYDPSQHQRSGAPPPMRPSVPFEGSTTHKEAFRGWQLPARRPALGVQMVGDRTYVLIPADAPLPAIGKQVFTTVHDNQQEMCILVLRGEANTASKNPVMGQFDLSGLPAGPKGSTRVEVTFHLDSHNVLTASAQDLDHSRQEQWLQQGSMVARTQSHDVHAI